MRNYNDKIATYGLLVAVVAIVVSLTTPEIRIWLGLEKEKIDEIIKTGQGATSKSEKSSEEVIINNKQNKDPMPSQAQTTPEKGIKQRDIGNEAGNQVETQPTSHIPSKIKISGNLGTRTIDKIKLVVTRFEQEGSTFTVHFTLENLSETETARAWSPNPAYSSLIDQKGHSFEGQRQVVGNSEEGLDLIYQNPVDCYLEFDVGAVQVTKVARLVIAAWYDPGIFEFTNIPVPQ